MLVVTVLAKNPQNAENEEEEKDEQEIVGKETKFELSPSFGSRALSG